MPTLLWSPDQARAYQRANSAKCAASNRLRWQRYREAKAKFPNVPASVPQPDPAASLEARLDRQIRAGSAPAVLDKLATALAKLRSGRSGSRPGRPKPVPAPKLVLTYDDPVHAPVPATAPVPALAPVPVPVPVPVPALLKPSLKPRPDQWDD